jgi:hypothetical protein
MNTYEPEPNADEVALPCDEESLLALREIYREAGLSDENARKSAAADLEQLFECLSPCAA